jgi:hypothetical protein
MACVICFDEMDMLEFGDERSHTETCRKLRCGHAYHTDCIIDFLSNSNHKCPACNAYKTPEAKFKFRAKLTQMLVELKREPDMQEITKEIAESKKEYIETVKQIKKESTAFVKQRMTELQLKEKRAYMSSAQKSHDMKILHAAKAKGPDYVQALKEINEQKRRNQWRNYRWLHPWFGIRL